MKKKENIFLFVGGVLTLTLIYIAILSSDFSSIICRNDGTCSLDFMLGIKQNGLLIPLFFSTYMIAFPLITELLSIFKKQK